MSESVSEKSNRRWQYAQLGTENVLFTLMFTTLVIWGAMLYAMFAGTDRTGSIEAAEPFVRDALKLGGLGVVLAVAVAILRYVVIPRLRRRNALDVPVFRVARSGAGSRAAIEEAVRADLGPHIPDDDLRVALARTITTDVLDALEMRVGTIPKVAFDNRKRP